MKPTMRWSRSRVTLWVAAALAFVSLVLPYPDWSDVENLSTGEVRSETFFCTPALFGSPTLTRGAEVTVLGNPCRTSHDVRVVIGSVAVVVLIATLVARRRTQLTSE